MNYSIIFLKVIRREQACKISQTFSCKHVANKSNAIVCLYSKYVCFDVFMPNKFFDFFRNMFNTKTIKVN